MIEPYYQDELCTIYNADCRDVLPRLEPVDLVLTDPPYGIGRSGQRETFTKLSRHKRKRHEDFGWDQFAPSDELLRLVISMGKDQIIWGGNYFPQALSPSMGWLVWDKGQNFSTSDCELAFTSRNAALRRLVLNRGILALDGADHPTQKPKALMKWCLGFFPEAKTVLDPFMGSGTTLRAAKDLGLKSIGIEIERKYCDIAIERLRQQAFNFAEAA